MLNPRAFDKFEFYVDWNLEDIHYARGRLEKKALSLASSSSSAAAAGGGQKGSSSGQDVDPSLSSVPLAQAMTR